MGLIMIIYTRLKFYYQDCSNFLNVINFDTDIGYYIIPLTTYKQVSTSIGYV